MTLDEYKSLKIDDVYFMYLPDSKQISKFTVLENVDNGYYVHISVNDKKKKHYLANFESFELSEERCLVELLKRRLRTHQQTEDRAMRQIRQNRRDLENFKEELSYNTLLEKYPEEFL